MATAYSEEVNPGGTGYNRIRLRVEYSGTSATCYIEFRRTSSWSDTWGDDAASITFNGQTVSAPYWYTGTVDGNWRTIDSAAGFTVPIAGGTFSWHFNNPLTGSVLDCGGTITIASQTTPPSGGSITNVSVTSSSITATVSLTSWGTGTTGRILRLAVLENGHYITTVGEPQYVADSTDGSLSATLTVNNNSTTYNSPSWTIQPNTQYDIGIYAETADGSYRYNYPSNPVRTAVPAKMYGSANGQAKRIQKMYGPVESLTDFTSRISDGSGIIASFDKDVFMAKMLAEQPEKLERTFIEGLRIRIRSGDNLFSTNRMMLFDSVSGTSTDIAVGSSAMRQYGFEYTTNHPTGYASIYMDDPVWGNIAREIKKLYGSVNGQAKLIYEG